MLNGLLLMGALISQDVSKEINDLGNEWYIIRDNAQHKLEQMGAAIKPQLIQAHKKAVEDKNAEVRLRLDALIDKALIEEAWLGSQIALPAGTTTSDALFELVNKQSGGNTLLGDQYGAANTAELAISEIKGNYWEVIDQLCRLSGNRYRPHYDNRQPGIVVAAGDFGKTPIAVSGPLRLHISSIRRAYSEDLDYETTKSEVLHTLQMNFNLIWEHKFPLLGYNSGLLLVDGETNHGNKLRATMNGESMNTAGPGTRQLTMNLRFHPTKVDDSKINHLHVSLPTITATDFRTIKGEIDAGKVFDVDGLSLEVVEVEKDKDDKKITSVEFLVVRDVIFQPIEAITTSFNFEFLDKDEKSVRQSGRTNSTGDDGISVKISFPLAENEEGPVSFEFKYPRLFSKRDVLFKFKDVPLPVARPE